jgi:hypothetical protein
MTVNCLADKLNEVRELLDSAKDASEIIQTCAAISAIVKAIEGLKSAVI